MRIASFSWLFSISILSLLSITTVPAHGQCLDNQRSLLLQWKNSLEFDPTVSVKLVNWSDTNDCCSWKGVTCDEAGRVTALDLNDESISGSITVSSSLFGLRFLESLNLANNNFNFNFNFTQVPFSFSNLTRLAHLNLSNAGFSGQVPVELLRMTRLVTLDLSNNRLLEGSLPQFTKSGSLQTLLLSYTSFSGMLPESIYNLRMLSRIELSGCNFSGRIPTSMPAYLPQLVHLDLSSNNFTGPIPLFQMVKNLHYIDLSHNSLTGLVPSFYFKGGLSNLVSINLAYNSFSGSIPSSLFSLPSLQKIQLSHNQFGGEVTGFSNESLPPLDMLDLSSNNLEGPIPTSFFELPTLSILLLSFNNFNGTIELETIQRLQNLTRLELSYNSLSINASDSKSSSSSFPQLSILKLASCKLNFFPDLKNQLRMTHLDLSDNQISGEIPNWIWKVGNGSLVHLNLSCNILVGLEQPYVFPSLNVLDLHSNQLRGEIPIPPQSVTFVDYSSNNFISDVPAQIGNNLAFAYFFSLSNNSLTGSIPGSICNASFIKVLDLSNNHFSSTIPPCLIAKSTETLGVLNLRNNNLGGNISGTFPKNCALRTMDISGNHLGGKVPISLANCMVLEVINLGNNEINDGFPCFLNSSSSLHVLVLRSNKFKGDIHCVMHHNSIWELLRIIDLASNNFTGDLPPKLFSNLKAMTVDGHNAEYDLDHLRFNFLKFNNFYYQESVTVTINGMQLQLVAIFAYIDFSNNNFQGEIPDTVGGIKSLSFLNLSRNAFTGPIPTSIGNLRQLELLDLSMNKLNGSIPVQLERLSFLSVLNLSYNQLVGMIPTGSQFLTFPSSYFLGNKGLCGRPLSIRCKDETAVVTSPVTPDQEKHVDHKMEIFVSAATGFVTSLGIFIGLLVFCKRWNQFYFRHVGQFLEGIFHLEERRQRRNRILRAYRDPIKF